MNLKFAQMGLAVLVFALLIATINAFDHTLKFDYPGPYCEKQKTCCNDRHDSCSMPIANTLCYCDEFCDRSDSSDCCPDYKSWCSGEPDPIISCFHNGVYFNKFNTTYENCNECRCLEGGHVECSNDLCLTDDEIVHNVNLIQQLSWAARRYDQWWGHKYSEGLILRLGTKEPTYRVKQMTRVSGPAGSLPRQFNASYISEVPDQGWCGSSWVISTTSVASDRFNLESQGKKTVLLSPQNILSCTRKQQGCNGGHLDAAWRYLHKHGVVDQQCYPYIERHDTCQIPPNRRTHKTIKCPAFPGVYRDFYNVGPAYSLSGEANIMGEIYHYGPVQATMKVYRDFFSYSSGVYRHTAASRDAPTGFHSVKLIGWGEERNGLKYWIAANSWGSWWGERGYFRIQRGTNECGIEEYVLAAWPKRYKTNSVI